MTDLIKAVQALIDSVADDNNFHGGLLSRKTTRCSDECRILINRMLIQAEQSKTVQPTEEPPP